MQIDKMIHSEFVLRFYEHRQLLIRELWRMEIGTKVVLASRRLPSEIRRCWYYCRRRERTVVRWQWRK
jgi:hypothetical protein